MASNDLNQKWDSCLSRFIEYSFKGAAAGFVIGVLFFKRRAPLASFSAGIGSIAAYNDCNRKLDLAKESPN
jgi:hypothetical protein